MSAIALNRNYELQLPNSYVDVDRDEMEYVDGGGYVQLNISKATLQRIARIGCILAGTIIGAAIGYKMGAGIGATIGGIIGFAAGFTIGNYVANNKITGGINWSGNVAQVSSGRYYA